MGYNMRDMSRAGKMLKNSMDACAQEKAAKFANPGGIWQLVLWPVKLFIWFGWGLLLVQILVRVGVKSPWIWIGMLPGFIVAHLWYRAKFTANHPFISAIVWLSIPILLLMFV